MNVKYAYLGTYIFSTLLNALHFLKLKWYHFLKWHPKNHKKKLQAVVDIYWTHAPFDIEENWQGDITFYKLKYFTKNNEEKTN